ncbi:MULTISPECIES: DUF3108 domain-containing protein [Mycetohabitans]|uniref:DUF3108 domain-containing protein n=1 Tax=Mycetohabitans rhizoxinica TaxID=412963 RepID=A0ABZ2PZA3_9BURK|nr:MULTISPECIES: DUF3108 domain-containing protein [Mycetohabitans]MCF7696733.1 DUF3108 domain-containing protein [Mycetohabitans sp. B2]MCG1048069.1 DUF3108 domain-containing protein [Mycetohabitans sp. B6]
MADLSSRAAPRRPRTIVAGHPCRRHARGPATRWVIALALVLLVHALVGVWLERVPGLNPAPTPSEIPVQVAVLTPRPIDSATHERAATAAGDAPRAASPHSPSSAAATPPSDALQAVVPQPNASRAARTGNAGPPPARTLRAIDDTRPRAPAHPIPADTAAQAFAGTRGPLAGKYGAGRQPQPATRDAVAGGTSPLATASDASNASPTPTSPALATSAASGTPNASRTLAASAPSPASAPVASGGEKFTLPPSADIRYDTFYNGVQNQAGTLRWTTDGSHYQMVVSMTLPFVGTYSFTSEGRVDAFGLAPQRYVEQRGRRGTDTTRFERDTQPRRIAFSRSSQTVPLSDGAQDRFSMVMQLASLVRGDPSAYTPGVTRQFFVADSDSGETWPIEMIGTESVQTWQGFVDALHFMRLPRRDGDRRRIDVWLCPMLDYLPVRLVQTEPNGTQVELLWHGKLPANSGTGQFTPSGAAGMPEEGTATPAEPAQKPPKPAPADAPASVPGIGHAESLPWQAPAKP